MHYYVYKCDKHECPLCYQGNLKKNFKQVVCFKQLTSRIRESQKLPIKLVNYIYPKNLEGRKRLRALSQCILYQKTFRHTLYTNFFIFFYFISNLQILPLLFLVLLCTVLLVPFLNLLHYLFLYPVFFFYSPALLQSSNSLSDGSGCVG